MKSKVKSDQVCDPEEATESLGYVTFAIYFQLP